METAKQEVRLDCKACNDFVVIFGEFMITETWNMRKWREKIQGVWEQHVTRLWGQTPHVDGDGVVAVVEVKLPTLAEIKVKNGLQS